MSSAASMVTKLSQHLMTCKPGCSLSEPESPKKAVAETDPKDEAVAVKELVVAETLTVEETSMEREEGTTSRVSLEAPLQ
jgi:O-antigen biosynthesis protein